MSESKSCPSCGACKSLDEYFPSQRYPGSSCKDCMRSRMHSRYLSVYVPKPGASVDPRSCVQCGTVYRPKRRIVSVFCSRGCKDRSRRTTPTERTCPYCAGPVGPDKRAGTLFCSKRCNDSAHRLQSKLRTRSGEVAKPGYLRGQIAVRDEWTCQLCTLPVDRMLWYPDPWFGTLDHVVPVSRGGSSDVSNLRLAHLRCNQLRGNRC